MNNNNANSQVLEGVANGSWLRSTLHGTQKHMLQISQPASYESSTTEQQIAPQKCCGVSVRTFIIASFVSSFAFVVVLLIYLELGDVINVFPPLWNKPPLPPPSPLPPALPPEPPMPPSPPSAPPLPKSPPYSPGVTLIKSSACRHEIGGVIVILTNNGRCEDGGEGSIASICTLGLDYPDCPPRPIQV
jgi:hypothetical protein